MSECHASLRRLSLDHIDLYQVHAFDPATPIEETLEALDTLVRAGDVRYIGLSNWAAWQIMKAIGIARARNLAPITSLQAYYTLVGRDVEREIVPLLTAEQVGMMVWSPLAGGYLSGKYADGGNLEEARQTELDFPPIDRVRGAPLIGVLKEVAVKHGRRPAQIAIGWLLKQPVVSTVIIGAKRVEQLYENLQAAEIELDSDDMRLLGAASRLPIEYPGWLLNRAAEQDM
jgi:aryl-alcohol dehydrogenase-like predicted oxidoreductase